MTEALQGRYDGIVNDARAFGLVGNPESIAMSLESALCEVIEPSMSVTAYCELDDDAFSKIEKQFDKMHTGIINKIVANLEGPKAERDEDFLNSAKQLLNLYMGDGFNFKLRHALSITAQRLLEVDDPNYSAFQTAGILREMKRHKNIKLSEE